MLRALRDTEGSAVAVSDEELLAGARQLATLEGVDASPEGGATIAAARKLVAAGTIAPDEEVVLLNTGAGVLYGADFK
jgi:threonine synthase